MVGLIILALFVGTAAVFLNLYKDHNRRVMPELYVEVARGTLNIEWLIRFLCRYNINWRLLVLAPNIGEEKRIIERLMPRYAFSLVEDIPPEYPYKLCLNKYSTPAEIKKNLKQISYLQKKGKPSPS